MGLIDKLRGLRQPEQNNSGEHDGNPNEDRLRRLRQRMRIFPKATASPSEVSQAQPAGEIFSQAEAENVRHLEAQAQPIVSIHGDDVAPTRRKTA